MKIVALPALVLFATSPSVSAAEGAEPTTPATVEALTQALGDHYKTVKTLQADVTQTSRTAMGESVMTGRMVVERPAKARWELQGSGYETLMVFDGAAGWLYTPASKQVIKMAGSGANAMDPIELVRTLDERFETRLVPDAPADRFVVEGAPNAGTQLAAQYKLIRLELEKGTYLPLVLVLTDNYGGSTEIAFADSVFNETVAASLFTFEPPAGVTVVDGSL
jgi:outer membrane lipoprotein carrier protein